MRLGARRLAQLSAYLLGRKKKLIREGCEFSEYLNVFSKKYVIGFLAVGPPVNSLEKLRYPESCTLGLVLGGTGRLIIAVRNFRIWIIVPDPATMCVVWRCSAVILPDRPTYALFPGV